MDTQPKDDDKTVAQRTPEYLLQRVFVPVEKRATNGRLVFQTSDREAYVRLEDGFDPEEVSEDQWESRAEEPGEKSKVGIMPSHIRWVCHSCSREWVSVRAVIVDGKEQAWDQVSCPVCKDPSIEEVVVNGFFDYQTNIKLSDVPQRRGANGSYVEVTPATLRLLNQ